MLIIGLDLFYFGNYSGCASDVADEGVTMIRYTDITYMGLILFLSSTSFLSPTQSSYVVTISVAGIPTQIWTYLQVDGQPQSIIRGSENISLSFPTATDHVIFIDQYVAGNQTGIRYYCERNLWTATGAEGHVFDYITQYRLTVNSTGIIPPMYAPVVQILVNGGVLMRTDIPRQPATEAWFNMGAEVQTEAPLNLASQTGTLYKLKSWQVDGKTTQGNPITITMNAPYTVLAVYQRLL